MMVFEDMTIPDNIEELRYTDANILTSMNGLLLDANTFSMKSFSIVIFFTRNTSSNFYISYRIAFC